MCAVPTHFCYLLNCANVRAFLLLAELCQRIGAHGWDQRITNDPIDQARPALYTRSAGLRLQLFPLNRKAYSKARLKACIHAIRSNKMSCLGARTPQSCAVRCKVKQNTTRYLLPCIKLGILQLFSIRCAVLWRKAVRSHILSTLVHKMSVLID